MAPSSSLEARFSTQKAAAKPPEGPILTNECRSFKDLGWSDPEPGATVPFEEADRAKRVLSSAALRLPVMSIDHLIAMKNRAGREQDRADIEVLERIKALRGKDTHG
jgi:hypothetical protein